jgi:aryl-alcohol dehydrogenase-like predicted oxidoreductase
MALRTLGRTCYRVNPVGLGTWAMGGAWGDSDDDTSLRTLRAAVERGVDFFDTADNYGDGHSEELLGRLRKDVPRDDFVVATKMGRRAGAPEYTRENFGRWVAASAARLGVDAIDMCSCTARHRRSTTATSASTGSTSSSRRA